MKIAILAVLLCMTTTSSVFAGGYYDGYRGDRYYHGGGHHRDGLGIAVGVVGGLLLGSALVAATAPPPPTVVYGYPQAIYYQSPVIVERPRACYEERIVNGEWTTSRYDGRQVWVSYRYPVTQTVQAPCY